MIVHVEGIVYPISVSSVDELRKIGGSMADSSLTTLLAAGGYCVFTLSQNQIDQVLNSDLDEIWKTDLRAIEPGPVISVLKDVDAKMTFEESMAILHHECGHIHHKHHEIVEAEAKPGEIKFLLSQKAEIEADAYALQFTTKEVLKSAVLKAMKVSVKFASAVSEIPFNELWEDAMAESAERFAALED